MRRSLRQGSRGDNLTCKITERGLVSRFWQHMAAKGRQDDKVEQVGLTNVPNITTTTIGAGSPTFRNLLQRRIVQE